MEGSVVMGSRQIAITVGSLWRNGRRNGSIPLHIMAIFRTLFKIGREASPAASRASYFLILMYMYTGIMQNGYNYAWTEELYQKRVIKDIFFHRGCYDLSLEPNLKRILTYKAPKSRGHNLCLRNFKAWLIQATSYREFKSYRTDQVDPNEVTHGEPPHVDLWHLQIQLVSFYGTLQVC